MEMEKPIPSSFPIGLHILVVDDDPTCLMVVEKMLKKCRYEVTTCEKPMVALSMLRERKFIYDVVLTDVHMPELDGFQLLEIVGLEMDLPVVMMSADCDVNVAMKGLEHGACYYLMKPVKMEELKNIWQHIIRKKRADAKATGKRSFDEEAIEQRVGLQEDIADKKSLDDSESESSFNEGISKKHKRKKEAKDYYDDSEDDDEHSAHKKRRVIWHPALHSQFLNAVNQIGLDKAVPKKILEIMNVPGISRENIASHLQKYRLFLRRLNDAHQTQQSIVSSLTWKTKLGPIPPPNMFDFPRQTDFPKFSELFNPLGLQPRAVGNMHNLNTSMTSINPMPFLNQDSQINNPLPTFRFGKSTLNGPGNMQSALLPGSSNLGMKGPQLQQNDENMGVGMVPQLMKTGLSSLPETAPINHQQPQPRPALPSSGPLDFFGMQNVQNMGNVQLLNSFNQPPPFNFTSNYSGLQLTSCGSLDGISWTGPIGEGLSNIDSGNNLTSETKGKMPLEMEGDNLLLPELNSPDFNLDPFPNFTNPDEFQTQDQNNNVVTESCAKADGDLMSDILNSSTVGNSSVPQSFGDAELDDLLSKQPQEGTDLMDTDFDFDMFHIDDIDDV